MTGLGSLAGLKVEAGGGDVKNVVRCR